jgi:thiol-disulfide isomerase/thioredoxin
VITRWKRFALEALVFVVIVGGIQAWRARDLLPADERTAAPPFELVDLAGHPWNNASLAGKPAVIYFFAPWCGVCAASAPQLRWFHRWRGDDVQVLLIGLDYAAVGELHEYARKHALNMPVLIGNASVGAAYRIRGYPNYYVVDARGRIARRDMGYTTVAGLWLRTIGL